MIRTLIFIGAGSFIGGIARYLLTRWIQNGITSSFPFGTLVVNLVGCLLIGLLFGLFERFGWFCAHLRAFLTVGFCGGFTTFSTFAMESAALMRNGSAIPMFLYLWCSVGVGIGAVWLGSAIARNIG